MARGQAAFLLASSAVAWCVAWSMGFALSGSMVLAAPVGAGAGVCAIAWLGLRAHCVRESRSGRQHAEAGLWILLVLALAGSFYGGLYVLPAAGMLMFATFIVPPGLRA